MPFTEDEIIQILKIVEQSNFDELHLESNDLKLVIRKGASGLEAAKENGVLTLQSSLETNGDKPLDRSADQEVKDNHREKEELEEGHLTIKAPLLGTFYRRSEPGKPVFVDVGTLVDEDTTVCIIEVMKVFSTIKAGVKGYISKVCAENGELVEYGQPLFLVKPL